MDDLDCRILATISDQGYDVVSVGADGDATPSFSYSVGMAASLKRPDVIVIGLSIELGGRLVDEYCRRTKSGERFKVGDRYRGFLDGFDVCFEHVAPSNYETYLRFNVWGYGGRKVEALQLLYPNTSAVWPWEAEAGDWFRSYQRILTADGRTANDEA